MDTDTFLRFTVKVGLSVCERVERQHFTLYKSVQFKLVLELYVVECSVESFAHIVKYTSYVQSNVFLNICA